MKLATWNLWNSPVRWPERLDAACEVLSDLDADIVALQEVPARVSEDDDRNAARYLADRCGFGHVEFRPYPDDPREGLAFIGNVPFQAVEAGWATGLPSLGNCGLRMTARIGATSFALTNVHLDYAGIVTREAQVSDVLRWIEDRSAAGQYEVLCGDFNCPPDSSVYRFLMGQQSLSGRGTQPWHDLARYAAERVGKVVAPTLDFWNNPRWRDAPNLEVPARVDWILLRDLFECGLPWPRMTDAGIFGVEPARHAGVVASDHYGVYADLELGAGD
jgi:endonuclease/exonuclease/phosphatase family metal-dependent hydrolase